ncbi:DUF4115 domain-containing protein [Sphingomonas donggukensis]|uniref:DUF4115 domain-containing protein n=1 Tax=Sphingomonas donggukensis TaxID=2949093 RepID=A0ABY4TSV7_9SPHN|nr:helix-turn-helix domain-containing protein [Sphingomonas donggukensis]URW75024.1 DUF4115 domain-containing protein [Sphingomonas donggukensis]
MSESETIDTASRVPMRPGERLRDARSAQRLEISDIAQRTRIPQRHLEAIEAGNYASLPSTTYAVGFGKAYARAVGLDEVAIANEIRGEIASDWDRPATAAPVYEVEDNSRVPSRGLVVGGIVVALLVLAGVFLWYGTNLFRGGTPSGTASAPVAEVAMPVPAPGTTSPAAPPQVTITANDEVWVRIYDAADTTLLMKTMAPGERYDVPSDANRPMINVGRPDKLSIMVNGAAVAPLGDGKRAIKDVPVDAQALLARGAPAGAGTTAPATPAPATPAPAAAPTAAPTVASAPTPAATPTPRASPTARATPRARPTPRPTARATEVAVPPPVIGNGIYEP